MIRKIYKENLSVYGAKKGQQIPQAHHRHRHRRPIGRAGPSQTRQTARSRSSAQPSVRVGLQRGRRDHDATATTCLVISTPRSVKNRPRNSTALTAWPLVRVTRTLCIRSLMVISSGPDKDDARRDIAAH